MATYLLGPGLSDAADTIANVSSDPRAGRTVIEAEDRVDWVAALAALLHAQVTSGQVSGPYVVIARGDTVADVPALAFALRSARRPASGYVLVEPAPSSDRQWTDWPDAPVTVITCSDRAAHSARLRGWHVVVGPWPGCLIEALDRA